ncbi:hypothetical protein FJT64_018378 [Amphibalanus amphitrite]|uniref:Secreted protein n=1 Tax=Amphibalanus amphitrite TaxID=1232801 RepID=A0A6A4X3S3_AMPAM|nr:hypothetical protein FJT64_018378 [Amphibalanus amphitrite]
MMIALLNASLQSFAVFCIPFVDFLVRPSVRPSVSLSLSVRPSVHPSVRPSVRSLFGPSVRSSVTGSHLPVFLSVPQSPAITSQVSSASVWRRSCSRSRRVTYRTTSAGRT